MMNRLPFFSSFVQFKTIIRSMHVAFKLPKDQMTVSPVCHCQHLHWRGDPFMMVSLTEKCLSKTQQLFSSNGLFGVKWFHQHLNLDVKGTFTFP